MLRRQLPAYSPITARALARGLGAALLGDHGAQERVEGRIRRRFSGGEVLFTDSGTSALALALRVIARGRPATIALPAYSCFDLATAVQAAGVEAVLYDLDPGTLGPDWASLERTLSRTDVAAVVAAHLYGVPVDMRRVAARASAAGAAVVEDAAQGVGGSLAGRPLGTFGDLSVLSFGRGKGLTGGGGGGALIVHESAFADRLREASARLGSGARGWRELIAGSAQWALGRPGLYWLPATLPFLRLGETVYHAPGPVGAASDASLAILEENWEPSLREAGVRQHRADELRQILQASPDLASIEIPDEGVAGYLRYPVLAEDPRPGFRLATTAARTLGIMPGYPKPLHRLAEFRVPADSLPEPGYPGAERLATGLYTLPVHGRLSGEAWRRAKELVAR